ncbi:hypothetical protein C9374_004944 [Naegleria lovaniensis]|uniref:DIS3-like exonuclease 1 n=1 Tax=Naegleria lovaniensis TaxID=51637 RepID=A0AA88GR38_NAELO|nr:uncharacterized protein C9374_004944 [Naegleria lovaniensis]KAG2382977.1 hypothetical protein C9374_004944 [Naegleria lovaniensis]
MSQDHSLLASSPTISLQPSSLRVFHVRAKKSGNIVRITREVYTRDDIWCQSRSCKICKHTNPVLDEQISSVLSNDEFEKSNQSPSNEPIVEKKDKKKKNSKTTSSSSIPKKPSIPKNTIIHYVIPTSETILKYLEIFEVNVTQNIIFCETVFDHIQNNVKQSNKMTSRIRTIISDKNNRKSIMFSNEHSNSTVITPRTETETIDMRNERAILKTAEWYASHLKDTKILIILLTIDDEQSKRMNEMIKNDPLSSDVTSLKVMTLKEYISHPNYLRDKSSSIDMAQLYENVTITKEHAIEEDNEFGFTDYLSPDVIELGLKSDKYLKGVLRVNQHNSRNAHIKTTIKQSNGIDEEEVQIKVNIDGTADRNRAVHGDSVVVELKPKSEWKTVTGSRNDTHGIHDSKTEPTGRVVGILERNWREYVACLEENTNPSTDWALVIPMDSRIPKIRIKTRQKAELENMRIIVRISDWEKKSKYPSGFYVRTLGPIGDLDTETEGLLVENQLYTSTLPFSELALGELPPVSNGSEFKIPQSEIQKRRDIRKTHLVCSIDPIGCEDIDDALSVRRLPNNNIEVGVHIADVAYFIKYDGYLDLEARRRSTTVYLIDRRLDMIPTLLSADLASIRQGQDRLCVSVFWEFNKEGQVVDTWYGRTILNSKYALHYEQADEIVNGNYPNKNRPKAVVERNGVIVWKEAEVLEEDIPKLKRDISTLQQLATLIQAKRLQAGALELNDLEAVSFKLDHSKKTVGIVTKDDLQIHHTVAEWMILANSYVAKKIYDSFPVAACLRRHPYPMREKFQQVIKVAASKGFEIDLESGATLAHSLDQATDPEDKFVNLLIRSLTTRAMSEAEYFSTGTLPVNDFYHYGLALQFYTHFTSPIRRYADIVVHRLLLWAINNESNPFSTTKLDEMTKYMNTVNRASKMAQMESSEWFKANYFKDHKDTVEDAIIFNLKSNAIYVFISTFRIKGIIYLTTKEGEFICPETERKKYQLPELMSPIQTYHGWKADIEFSEENIRNIEMTVSLKKVDDNKQERFKFHIFDHVQVKINIDESRSHLPKVKLELVTLKANKMTSLLVGNQASSNASKEKKSVEKMALQSYKEQKQREKEAKDILPLTTAEDVEYLQKGSLYNYFQSTQKQFAGVKMTLHQVELEEMKELTKKKKAIEKRLHDIAAIKEKIKHNENLAEEEKAKLESEAKYQKNLSKVEKLLAKMNLQ